MDLLSHVLHLAGLKKRLLHQRSFSKPIALEFPCGKSFGFHVVLQGEAFIHQKGQKPIQLKKGDIALICRGINHVVSTNVNEPKKLTALSDASIQTSLSHRAPLLTLISGAYQVWNNPVHPLFDELPQWFILRSDDMGLFDELNMGIQLLSKELNSPAFGSETITNSLLDVLFTAIFRKILEKHQTKPKSWAHATSDTQIKTSIEMLHKDYAQDWTLEELARKVGLSRAGFAQKFKSSLGVTPFQYLTALRVQKSMELLSSSDSKLEQIAESVGYKDAFTFSKVFKKITGISPRDFRSQDAKDKELAWRF